MPTNEADKPTLFVDGERVPQSVFSILAREGVKVEPYEAVVPYLSRVGADLPEGVSGPSFPPSFCAY